MSAVAWTPEDTARAHALLTQRGGTVGGGFVAIYCDAFKLSKRDPDAFARFARAFAPGLVLAVLETIGSWPSSEPELAALQRCAP